MAPPKEAYITPEGKPYKETWHDFPEYKPSLTCEVQARFDDLLLLPKRLKLARLKDIPFEVARHTEMVRRAKFTQPQEEATKDGGSDEKNKEGKQKESSAGRTMTSTKWLSTVSPLSTQVSQTSPKPVKPPRSMELLWLYAVLCAVCFMMALFPPFRKLVFREIIVKVIIDEILAPILGVMCTIGDKFPVVRDIVGGLYNIFGFWILAGGGIWVALWIWENRKCLVLYGVKMR
jgi:hypothetical protein